MARVNQQNEQVDDIDTHQVATVNKWKHQQAEDGDSLHSKLEESDLSLAYELSVENEEEKEETEYKNTDVISMDQIATMTQEKIEHIKTCHILLCKSEESKQIHVRETSKPNQTKSTKITDRVSENRRTQYEYLKHRSFCIRIFVFLMSIILLLLSTSYCLGQVINTKLDIITRCSEPKTNEEIWQHSYEAYVNNGYAINEESQFGITNDACWTTNKIEVNTDQLWYSNKYTSEWQRNAYLNWKCFMFGLLAVTMIIVVLCNLVVLFMDIVLIKSKEYKKWKNTYVKTHSRRTNRKETQAIILCMKSVIKYYNRYFVADTIGWITLKLLNELFEFILQSQALLLYNGYNVFDPNNVDDIYLANKPQFIITFAAIIACNCCGSGFLWLSYTLFPGQCYGTYFNKLLFFVDKFSDFLYTIFPFYMLFMDDYNQNTNDITVLLGQLKMTSTLLFSAAYVPLLFLCIKCMTIMGSARKEMLNECFRKWQTEQIMKQTDDIDAASHNTAPMVEMYDRNGNLKIDIQSVTITAGNNWINKGENKTIKYLKRTLILFTSLCFICFSVFVLLFTTHHIESSKSYCHSITESKYVINGTIINNITLSEIETNVLTKNSELFLWNECLYQVYPFVYNNDDTFRCQCRVFVVDWKGLKTTENERKYNLNINQFDILAGALNHWHMLEKFYTFNSASSSTRFVIESSMYNSNHMRAFDWRDSYIISVEDGISAWNKLEYLAFIDTQLMGKLPSDIGGLKSVQYLQLHANSIQEISKSICGITSLRVLEIKHEFKIDSIPFCISQLFNLEAIWIDGTFVDKIPLSIFNLPNLMQLSLFNGNINYQNLLDYNNVSIDINDNDTLALNEWFEDNFEFNRVTEYWLLLNPICNEINILPSKLQHFINMSCSNDADVCDYSAVGEMTIFCVPRLVGDGQCDITCSFGECNWDNGDCVQLCFAPDINETNCPYEKLTNDKCDDGCDNELCVLYRTSASDGSNFNQVHTETWDNEPNKRYGADLYHCVWNYMSPDADLSENEMLCRHSTSIYLDPNLPTFEYRQCHDGWIGDGECDDACRTDECLNDDGDCTEKNAYGCGERCGIIYSFWNHFIPRNIYKINHTFACDKIWPRAKVVFEASGAGDYLASGNCTDVLMSVDYNHDVYMNFREFVTLAGRITNGDHLKYSQVNCSQCMDNHQYYNV